MFVRGFQGKTPLSEIISCQDSDAETPFGQVDKTLAGGVQEYWTQVLSLLSPSFLCVGNQNNNIECIIRVLWEEQQMPSGGTAQGTESDADWTSFLTHTE